MTLPDPRWTAGGNGVGRGPYRTGWRADIICHGDDRKELAQQVADALNDADSLHQARQLAWRLGHQHPMTLHEREALWGELIAFLVIPDPPAPDTGDLP